MEKKQDTHEEPNLNSPEYKAKSTQIVFNINTQINVNCQHEDSKDHELNIYKSMNPAQSEWNSKAGPDPPTKKKGNFRTPSNFFKNFNRKSDFLKSNEVNKSQEALQLFKNLKMRKMKYNQFDPLGMLKTNSKEVLFLSEAPQLESSESDSNTSFERKINFRPQVDAVQRATSDLLSSKMSSKSGGDSFDMLNISHKRLSDDSGYSFSLEANEPIFSENGKNSREDLDIYAGEKKTNSRIRANLEAPNQVSQAAEAEPEASRVQAATAQIRLPQNGDATGAELESEASVQFQYFRGAQDERKRDGGDAEEGQRETAPERKAPQELVPEQNKTGQKGAKQEEKPPKAVDEQSRKSDRRILRTKLSVGGPS